MEQLPVEAYCLPNGMRVVLEPMPYVRTAAFGIYVGVGSACETKENNGISHMIEHMLFKGTKTRSAGELADLTARLGDTVNAYTGKEYTAYYGVTVAEELKSLIEVLSDMLQNSVFAQDALSKEKAVIIDEIEMYNDSPDDYVHEFTQKRVWAPHSLGFQISGNKGTVRAIDRNRLLTYYQKMYQPQKMVLSVAGAFVPEEIKEYLEELFCPAAVGVACRLKAEGKLYDDRYGVRNQCGQKARNKAETGGSGENVAGAGTSVGGSCGVGAGTSAGENCNTFIRESGTGSEPAAYTRCFAKAVRDTSQLHMNLVFPSISYRDDRRELASVFVSVLGGSNNSELFQKIREENGLAYSVYAYSCPYAKEGLLYLSSVSAPAQAEEIFLKTVEICEGLKEKPVSEETLQTHKSLIRTEMILSNESVQSRMERNGRNILLYGGIIPMERVLARMDAVTPQEVCDYAREILDLKKMSLCIVGEMKQAEHRLRRRFDLC